MTLNLLLAVSPPAGFPDHPHRGFEAVTLMLQGAFSYEDFYRNKGTLHAGDVQWMRVGKGIMHSEKPAEDNSHGLQIWINLPTIAKSYDPSYQNIRATEIPQAEKNGVRVRVIAGKALGVEAPCHSLTPTMILDFTLRPNAELHQSIPTPWNALAYVIRGEGTFGKPDSPPVYAHEAVVLSAGDGVRVWNNSSTDQLRFLLLAGQPLNEPVVQYGPFVMNTQAEIDQTIQDYRSREHVFGRGKTWTSSN
uniref:Pirin n=2 Tax=Kalanchoe fedtschenkoi TaxID=63787 RepID=A0A7N0TSC3_KALFE